MLKLMIEISRASASVALSYGVGNTKLASLTDSSYQCLGTFKPLSQSASEMG